MIRAPITTCAGCWHEWIRCSRISRRIRNGISTSRSSSQFGSDGEAEFRANSPPRFYFVWSSRSQCLWSMDSSRRLAKLPANPPGDGEQHQQHAQLHVYFLAIQKVDWIVLEIRVGQNAVDVEEQRRRICSEVERLPRLATELVAEVRGQYHKRQ